MKNLNQPLTTAIKLLCGTVAGMSLFLSASPALYAADEAPTVTVSPKVKPESRNFSQMLVDEALNPLSADTAEAPFRTTMEEGAYQLLKQAGDQGAPDPAQAAEAAVASLAPATLKTVNCNGLLSSQSGGWVPPDTHGAVGHTHYVQVVNSQIQMYRRADIEGDINVSCSPVAKSVSLNSFMGYFTKSLFDPRVVYDPQFQRWIVSAEAFAESATVQFHFVAISKTSDPTGGYWIYKFDMNLGGEFYDYPDLGFNADGLIITANLFNPGYVGSRVTMLSKSRVYNGLGVSFCNWSGGVLNYSTIAPPIVRDLGTETWLAAAGTADTKIRVTRWGNVGHVCGTFIGTKDIPVAAYSTPADAIQPGTTVKLDTLDARFENAGTQVGNFLYNVHSIASGSRAIVRRYKINVPAGTATSISFASSSTSFDFNPSIAVNDALSEFLTFSRSDSATRAQVRFTGKASGDASFSSLVTALTSTASQTNTSRWGDYSAITIDPTNSNLAWGVNEYVSSSTVWGSRIFKVGIP